MSNIHIFLICLSIWFHLLNSNPNVLPTRVGGGRVTYEELLWCRVRSEWYLLGLLWVPWAFSLYRKGESVTLTLGQEAFAFTGFYDQWWMRLPSETIATTHKGIHSTKHHAFSFVFSLDRMHACSTYLIACYSGKSSKSEMRLYEDIIIDCFGQILCKHMDY